MTPQNVRDRALALRIPLSHALKKAGVLGSTFYRWEKHGATIRPLTLAKIDDALTALEE